MSKKVYKPWSTKELQKAIELKQRGKSCVQIGEILDRKPNNVRNKLYMSGVKTFEVKTWTPEEWALAQKLRYEDKLMHKEIADILGRKREHISNKFRFERERLKHE